METFGMGHHMQFGQPRTPQELPALQTRQKEEEPVVAERMETRSEEFQSFGYSIKTTTISNNLSKMFTQLENSVLNPILLSALCIIEKEEVVVTGGSADQKLRFWSIVPGKIGFKLHLDHEMLVFTNSATNIKYIPSFKLLLAGDNTNLFLYDMTDFLVDREKKPVMKKHLLDIHWMRCMCHFKTEREDWLLTARKKKIFYFDLRKMKKFHINANPEPFVEKIMCFQEIHDGLFVIGNGMRVSFWKVFEGKRIGQDRIDHEKLINKILYVKKKKSVLSGGDDGYVFVYRLHLDKPRLQLMQKISPSGSTRKSFVDSLIYFEEQGMLFCTNRTNSVTIFCFNKDNMLKEKNKIQNLKFKVTGLAFWKKKTSLVAYSSLVPEIIILGFMGNSSTS